MKHSRRYLKYLKSRQWQKRRSNKLAAANHRCELCSERDSLQVHHKHYRTLGNESTDDLIVLCTSCHWAADEARKQKSTKILNKFQQRGEKSKAQHKREARARRRKRKGRCK